MNSFVIGEVRTRRSVSIGVELNYYEKARLHQHLHMRIHVYKTEPIHDFYVTLFFVFLFFVFFGCCGCFFLYYTQILFF